MARIFRPHREPRTLDTLQAMSGLGQYLRSDLGVNGSGGKVTTWYDQSGNGLDVTQATAGSRPTYTPNLQNGMPGLVFGGSHWLASAVSGVSSGLAGLTVFCVGGTALSSGLLFSQWGSPGTWYLGAAGTNQFQGAFRNATTTVFPISASNGMTALGLYEAKFDGAHHTVYKNGTQVGISTISGVVETNSRTVNVGSGNLGGSPLTGNIFACVLFTRALSGAEQTTVRNFLNGIYAIF